MGGRSSKVKGYRMEADVVNWHRERGIDAERIPLSGAAKGSYAGDVRIMGLTAECKIRANGFKELYGWLDHDKADLLVVRADRKEPLYIVPQALWEQMTKWCGWSK